jgi:hypothetical protein
LNEAWSRISAVEKSLLGVIFHQSQPILTSVIPSCRQPQTAASLSRNFFATQPACT